MKERQNKEKNKQKPDKDMRALIKWEATRNMYRSLNEYRNIKRGGNIISFYVSRNGTWYSRDTHSTFKAVILKIIAGYFFSPTRIHSQVIG